MDETCDPASFIDESYFGYFVLVLMPKDDLFLAAQLFAIEKWEWIVLNYKSDKPLNENNNAGFLFLYTPWWPRR